ncbi:MAG: gliding motility-associated C-terminal domain-containing protein [Chitinophagaceae bacterium]|nr:gliding motility-associated C-terminal domain-containing protein [Chitinophagaceae bacterium]
MKNSYPYVTLIWMTCMVQALVTFSQPPPRQWAKKFGGSAVDIPYTLKNTTDGGTIAAGYTDSKNGDVAAHANREYWDLWVIKLDRCGNIQWEKSFGGTGYESARDVAQTPDGGFIVLGETNSTDGGVVAGYGGTKDIWLLKLDINGNIQWQKRYGGNGLDIGNHLHILDDGNYLIAASTSSNDGDVTGNHGAGGYTDGLLLKINPSGFLLWSKCYGGSKNDELLDIEIIGGRIYIAGYANSTDGDIPTNQKNYDVWLLAIDKNANKIFSKIYGGSQNDVAYSMSQGTDGTLTLAGYTTSTDGDVSGAKGSQDFWVLNVATNGLLRWQKVLGGTEAEYANTIITDRDGGYLVGGISYSTNGDITGAKGKGDYWVVKLTATGIVSWKQNYGGRETDHLRFITYQPSLNEYYLAGDSDSRNGDFTNSRGEADFAIIKLKQPEIISVDSVVCNVNMFAAASDTIRDRCGYDSALVNYKPVILKSPFDQLKKIDTIFEGENIALPVARNGRITWNADPSLSCTNCMHPVATPLITTSYTATNSLDHCSISDRFTVVVLKDAVVYIPNAFTPDGDGVNDSFGAIGKVRDEYRMQIFNRYGEIVFKSSSINNKWNGYYKGILQPNSVFIYQITYKDLQNRLQQKKGTLVLVR